MTCRTAHSQMTELPGSAPAAGLREHIESCPDCARRFEQLARALAAVTPPAPIRASAGFKERTMQKLDERLAAGNAAASNSGRGWFRVPRLIWAAAAIAAVAIAIPLFTSSGQSGPMKLLAQSAQAMSRVETVHMVARMRTLPTDNFELIGTDYDFVPVEMWKQFTSPPKWRVEKPGRVVVMDGSGSILYYGGSSAMRGGANSGFVEWLKPLLDADQVLARELAAARAGETRAALSEQMNGAARRLALTVTRKAQGNYANDWMRNKSVLDSDHTRVYTFDASTSRLTGLAVLLETARGPVPVFEITDIRYNEVFQPSLFQLDLPATVVWIRTPEEMPVSARPLPATPRETAVAFFDALAAGDWNRVGEVYPGNVSKLAFAEGLQVLSVGEPFKSGLYGGSFVPYEVRLKDGRVKKFNLAVRNDNSARRYHVDGGF